VGQCTAHILSLYNASWKNIESRSQYWDWEEASLGLEQWDGQSAYTGLGLETPTQVSLNPCSLCNF
jgi:hypothetical protein